MPYTQENRTCSVFTKLGKDVLFLSRMSGHEGVSQLFNLHLELLSIDDSIDFSSLIGTSITIAMELPNGKIRYLNGIISRFSQRGADQRFVSYHAEVVPWLWLLTRKVDNRIFQEMKVPDIIKKVFDDLNLKDYEVNLSGSYEKRDYCVQYRESDFNFVCRLMEEEGIFYFFKHEEKRHVLVLGDSADAHSPCPEEPDAVYCGTEDKPVEGDHIKDLKIEQVLHSGKFSQTDYNFETPNVDLAVNTVTKTKVGNNDSLEIYEYRPGFYGAVGQGEAYAKIRIEEQEAGAVTVQGHGNCRVFLSGFHFKLNGFYRADFDKKEYLITSMEYTLVEPAKYESGGAQEAVYENRFVGIPNTTKFRPARITPRPCISGPQTAVVVGPSGEEIHTDKYGRVKVLFHWDRVGEGDDKSSCWIRVSESWAGKKWGSMFLPRIGQEVIVEFLEGNPDKPIITGRVYNASQMPPYDLPENQTISTIKSQSSKGGGGSNEIQFEDKKGEEMVFIHAQKNMDLRVKSDRKEAVGNDRHLTVTRDKLEQVERDKHLIIKRDEVRDIKRDQNLKITGKAAIEVGDSRSVKITGDLIESSGGNISRTATGDCYIKAMNVVVEAMTGLTIKAGSNFVTLDSTGLSLSGTMININTGGSPLTGKEGSIVAPGAPIEAVVSGEVTDAMAPEAAKAHNAPWQGDLKVAAMAAIQQGQSEDDSEDQEEKTSWIEIELVDEDDNPIAGEKYSITLPDGKTVSQGSTNAEGKARVEGLDPGTCKVTFPELDKESWEKI